jgi:L-lactate dehydrogenase complex protein LldG
MTREEMLKNLRSALNRPDSRTPGAVPEVRLNVSNPDLQERIRRFSDALEKLSGQTHCVDSIDAARDCIAGIIKSGKAVASGASILQECDITGLPGVQAGPGNEAELRNLCSTADFGITGADYAIADTGSLVMLSSANEARMISLLPPVHIAVLARDRILANLDELFLKLPDPGRLTSSMVLITGPSRTADIEQILIRRVHGPGDLHVIIV